MNRQQAIDFIKAAHFGYLATIGSDHTPHVRPIGIDTVYGDDLYFFTFSTTRKVAEIRANPQVEVVWSNNRELSQVRVQGQAEIVEDESVKQKFKTDNPMVGKLLPPGAENIFCLCRIKPARVEAAEGLVPYQPVDW